MQRDGGINGKMKKKELKGQLKQAYMEEELYWSQKARCKWLKHGDKNTQFFHANVRGRRKKNRMQNIQRDDGSWAVSEEDLGAEIARYYQQLFSGAEVDCLDEILEGIPQLISQQMNAQLTRKVEEREIKKAVFSMDPNTAPGSDGMSPFFFQKFWYIIKYDIIRAIQSSSTLVICLNPLTTRLFLLFLKLTTPPLSNIFDLLVFAK